MGGRHGIGDGDADRPEDSGNVQAGNQTVRLSAAVQVLLLLRLVNRSLNAIGLLRNILT
jgi:hypothetical protein